jgi:two-component system, cell cycle sensor histidine kinase and response regulator CckA
MVERLAEIISPPVFEGHEEKTRTAAVLNALLWNLIALLTLVCVGMPFVFAARLESGVAILMGFVVLWMTRWLMRQGRVELASALLVICLGGLFAGLTVLTGGIFSVNLVLLLALSVVAGLLLGARWAIGVAVGSSALALVLAALEITGHSPPKPFPAPPVSRWAELSLGFAIALIPLNMGLRNLAKALERSKHELQVRLRAEEALRHSEERFRAIYDSVNDAVFIHDAATGQILDVNSKMTEMYGWSREESRALTADVSSSGEEGFTERDAAAWLARAAKGESVCFEWHARTRDGTLFWVEVSMRRAEIAGQSVILASVRDIDERVRAKADRERLEDQLLQAQKLESIGRLAGGVAHDFNNILTAILGNLELAALQLPEDAKARGRIDEAIRAGGRAADLTSKLLAFSRKQTIEPVVLDLKEVVASIDNLLARLLREDIVFSTSFGSALGAIKADRTQIEQILINLAVNARDAMPEGGKLSLNIENVDIDTPPSPDAEPGPYVRISVTDTGHGMDPETLENIFEPFFTTKKRGKGTGLGLASVFGATKQNGGFINVRSAPGQGTTFEIHLPRAVGDGVPVSLATLKRVPDQGSETVFVVEDDADVRGVACSTLAHAGYQVLSAATAEEALATLSDCEQIDLLLTDVILPGMTGRALAEKCQARQPSLRVLFTSGYPDDVITHHGKVDENVDFLAKPFGPEALAQKVREVLDGGARVRPG